MIVILADLEMKIYQTELLLLYQELQKKHLKELSSNKRNNFAFLLCSQQKIKPTLNGCALSKPTEQED